MMKLHALSCDPIQFQIEEKPNNWLKSILRKFDTLD